MNEKYIKHKFKVMFGNMKEPTLYAEIYNGKYTKTYIHNNELTSDFITLEEYAAAHAHIILRASPERLMQIEKEIDKHKNL